MCETHKNKAVPVGVGVGVPPLDARLSFIMMCIATLFYGCTITSRAGGVGARFLLFSCKGDKSLNPLKT